MHGRTQKVGRGNHLPFCHVWQNHSITYFLFKQFISERNPRKEVSPLSKKRKPQYPPGWSPPNAVAWCAYHNTGMNYSFIRRRRCLLHKKPCKHLHWFADAINHDEEQMI